MIHGVSIADPASPQKHSVVEDVDAIARLWRFNLVRVGCAVNPRPGAAKSPDLDEIVRAFTARGIVVLIDPRDHVAGWYRDPAAPPGSASLTELVEWYKGMAARYRSNPFVWFTVMSGPGSRDEQRRADPWREAHARVIAAIRKDAAAPNIIVCEGRYRGDDTFNNGALPVRDDFERHPLLRRRSLGPYLQPALCHPHRRGLERGRAQAERLLRPGAGARAADLRLRVREVDLGRQHPAIEAMFAVCKARHIGRCVWNWFPFRQPAPLRAG